MSYKSNWANGGWLVICDACGRKFKESELRKRWDGLMVCRGDWEVRQPQDFVRGVADIQAPPFVRPEQQNSFLPFDFTQYPVEELPVEERFAKNFNKVVYNYSATSATLNGDPLNTLALNALGSYLPDPEQLLITENYYFGWEKYANDTLSISESKSFSINKRFSEFIPIGETVYEDETETTIESLGVVESLGKMFGKGLSESFSLVETLSVRPTKPFTESISMAETNYLGINKNFPESVAFTESQYFVIGKIVSESIAIAEVVSTTLTSGATSLVNASALNTSPMGS